MEELKAAFLEAIALTEKKNLSGILVDGRESRAHPGFNAMRDLADFVLELHNSGLPRTALVVEGSLRFGLARMFGSLVEASGWEFRIFREFEPSEAWLTRR